MPRKSSFIFSFKSLLAHACGVSLIVAVYLTGGYVSNRNDIESRQAALFSEGVLEFEAVVLGNSHANAVDLEQLGSHGCYLNVPGATAMDTSVSFDIVLRNGQRPHLVFMSISPGSFSVDTESSQAIRIREYRAWGIPRDFVWRDTQTVLRSMIDPLRLFLRKLKSYCLSQDEEYLEMDSRGKWDYGSMLSARPWPQQAVERVNLHIQNFRIDEPGSEVEFGFAYMQKLLADVAAKGTRVVLFTPPYSRAYLDALPSGILETLDKQARRFASRIPGAVYVNNADSELSDVQELFIDPDHLNSTGAKRYSRDYLLPLLEKLGWSEPCRKI